MLATLAAIVLAVPVVIAPVARGGDGVSAGVAADVERDWGAAFAAVSDCAGFTFEPLPQAARKRAEACGDDLACLSAASHADADVVAFARVTASGTRHRVAAHVVETQGTRTNGPHEAGALNRAGLPSALRSAAGDVCRALAESPPPVRSTAAASLDIGLDDPAKDAPEPPEATPAPVPEVPAVVAVAAEEPPPPMPDILLPPDLPEPAPAPAPAKVPPAAIAPAPAPAPATSIAPIVFAAISAAGLVSGALLGNAAVGAAAERDRATTYAAFLESQTQAERSALYANVSWSVALTSAALAAFLYATGDDSTDHP